MMDWGIVGLAGGRKHSLTIDCLRTTRLEAVAHGMGRRNCLGKRRVS